MPKFSFPIPGRSRNKNKNRETEKQTDLSKGVPSPSVSHSGSSYSKAQRFFGTDNDLNIDSPTRDDDSWMVPSSRSSVMSISISESTHSTRTTDDSGSFQASQADKWEFEGGVFPKPPRMNEKASSTVLGVRYEGDEDSRSNMSARLRNEDSSSTLKSYYDRQTSPLSISQQTSASSARDLALRKGLPLVIPKSPLLQVDSVDIIESLIPGRQASVAFGTNENDSKKKPAKLDLSMLFPKPRSHGKTTGPLPSLTPNSMLEGRDPITPSSGRRRLMKALSKESLRSQQSTRSNRAQEADESQTKNPSYQVYDHYQKSPGRPNQMDRIPESRVTESKSTASESYLKPSSRSGPPVRNQQSHLAPSSQSKRLEKTSSSVPCPWETSSIISASSHNTKGSKRTSNSNFSNADLQERSVLSLSSGSEEDESDIEPMRRPTVPSNDKASRILNGQSSVSNANVRLSNQQAGAQNHDSRGHAKRSSKAAPFQSIPESQLPDPRLSGPWSAPPVANLPALPDRKHSSKRLSAKQTGNEQQHLSVPREARHSIIQPRDPRRSLIAESHISRSSSVRSQASQKSSLQPTPPLSPSSMIFRVDPEHSNRFMAVTKQEEALLEALRQKRARMREKIIEEHETYRSPPRTAEEIKATRYSETSTIRTYRGSVGQSKQTVLMVMDTPVSDTHRICTAEPSPDLSDFLGFGSDEDTTPRASYIIPQRQGAPRPDSIISPTPRLPSVASSSNVRLSAVGSGYRFEEGRSQSVKRKTSSVRFTDDTRDGSFEEEDDELIWGM